MYVATTMLAVMLAQPLPSVPGARPVDCAAPPTSFVPHPRTKHHVYGSPIGPALVGHAKGSHHKHAPKKHF